MSHVATATVETLVAEVRVLMVGSRQVTLSVARQLDWVNVDDLDVFGRVRLGEGGSVIGRQRTTGALALARFDLTPTLVVHLDDDDLVEKLHVCRRQFYQPGAEVIGLTLTFEDRILHVARRKCEPCKQFAHSNDSNEQCAHWSAAGQDAVIRRRIADHDAWRVQQVALGELPLIVLAGLR